MNRTEQDRNVQGARTYEEKTRRPRPIQAEFWFGIRIGSQSEMYSLPVADTRVGTFSPLLSWLCGVCKGCTNQRTIRKIEFLLPLLLFTLTPQPARSENAVPAFYATGEVKVERQNSAMPLVVKNFEFWTSNGVWQIQLTDKSGDRINCARIEDGIRIFNRFTQDSNQALTTAEAYSIKYPPPGRWDMLACWLMLQANPDLPKLNSHEMRRFLMVELQEDSRNRGFFTMESCDPGSPFICSLKIANDGISIDTKGLVHSFWPPFDHGFLEFSYVCTALTNWNGTLVPNSSRLLIHVPRASGVTSNDTFAAISVTTTVSKVLDLGNAPDPTTNAPSEMMAIDQRSLGVKSSTLVNYVTSNDSWRSTKDPELRRLAKSYERMTKASPGQAMFSLAQRRWIILLAMGASILPMLFLLKRRRKLRKLNAQSSYGFVVEG